MPDTDVLNLTFSVLNHTIPHKLCRFEQRIMHALQYLARAHSTFDFAFTI